MEISWEFHISREDCKIFSHLSRDFNPVHSCKEFALKKGFQDILVYGALLASQTSRLIGQELPDQDVVLTSTEIKFHKPCYPDDALRFHSILVNKSDSTKLLEFQFKIFRSIEKLCSGKVNALWIP